MSNNKPGTLYVVATPIGNLQDMTLRAIEVLKQSDRIAAEDSRHSTPLLKHFSINKPIISLHDFNERERLSMLLDFIMQGESIALISDAGTPLISDPGFHLVREAKARKINVVPIPGPCAAITALCVSGLPTDKFTFQGFLPAKEEGRRRALMQLLYETKTMIFYEAPHRLLSVLQSMANIFGTDRNTVIARELTKLHETVILAPLDQHIERLSSQTGEIRGEIVILIEGARESENKNCEVVPEQVLEILLEDLPLKQAALLASKITGQGKNLFYKMALKKKDHFSQK